MKCPYCGSTHFDQPKSILNQASFDELPEEIRRLVPQIVQCKECQATFSERVLTDQTDWSALSAMSRRQPVTAAARA